MKATTVKARIDEELKENVEAVLGRLGLTTSAAITIFFNRIVLEQGLPFPVKIPNAATERAILDAVEGRNMTSYDSVEDFFADLKEQVCHGESAAPDYLKKTTPARKSRART